eukprot:ANDGO_02342.mRNA.1 Protein sym1
MLRLAFERYPIVVNAAVSAGLMSAGDAIAQLSQMSQMSPLSALASTDTDAAWWSEIRRRVDGIDWNRNVRMGVAGGLMGPLGVVWFGAMERVLPGRSIPRIAAKVALNSAIFAPIGLSVVLGVPLLLQGRPIEDISRAIQNTLPGLWLTGGLFWPAVHAVNLALIPLPFRPAVLSLAGLGWNVHVCSTLASRAKTHPSTVVSPSRLAVPQPET